MFSFVPSPELEESYRKLELQRSLRQAELEESLNTFDLAQSGSYLKQNGKYQRNHPTSEKDNMKSSVSVSDLSYSPRFSIFGRLKKRDSTWSVRDVENGPSSFTPTLALPDGVYSDSEVSTVSNYSVKTTVSRRSRRKYTRISPAERSDCSPDISDEDVAMQICNTFWRPSLSFHQYRFPCEGLVKFADIWPDDSMLYSLIEEATRHTVLRCAILDMCKVALRCGPLRLLKALIKQELVCLKQTFDKGSSMLHIACVAQNFDAVLYLISEGANMKMKDSLGRTPEEVCYCPKILKMFPNPGMSSYSPTKDNRRRRLTLTPPAPPDKDFIFIGLESSKHFDEVQLKLQMLDFDVNVEKNTKGNLLVHAVVSNGLQLLPMLLLLVKIQKADIEQENDSGMTPLMIAAYLGFAYLTDIILCVLGANPNNQSSKNKWSALHYASYENQIDVISVLLKRGADCNQEDEDGYYADDIACCHGYSDCKEVIVVHRTERMEQLTEQVKMGDIHCNDLLETDFFTTDQEGNTLLMTAAIHNKPESLEVLLEKQNAPIDGQHYKTGRTALLTAARLGNLEALKVLVKHRANPAIRDIEGFLPLHYAIRFVHFEIVDVLLQDTRSLTGLVFAKRLANHIQMQHKVKAAIKRRQSDIVMPQLLQCAVTGDAGHLYCILEDGDDVNPVSGVGNWPLYLAAENASDSTSGHLDVIKLLFDRGADISRQHPTTGNTILHVACSRGQLHIVDFIIQSIKHQAECKRSTNSSYHSHTLVKRHQRPLKINSVNADNKTALQLAADRGYSRIVKLLLNAGATTTMIDTEGKLYSCPDYQGVQVLIEQKREYHTNDVMRCIDSRKKLVLLKTIWIPRFDHNLRDKHGNTPLMVASKKGKLDLVMFMLDSAVYKVHSDDQSTDSIISDEDEWEQDSGAEVWEPVVRRSVSTYPDIPIEYAVEIEDRFSRTGAIEQSFDQSPSVKEQGRHYSISGTEFLTSTPNNGANNQSPNFLPPLDESLRRASEPAQLGNSWVAVKPAVKRKLDFKVPSRVDSAPGGPPEHPPLNNIENFVHLATLNTSNTIFTHDNQISHVCATNSQDGCTALHRAIEGGDYDTILTVLIMMDGACVNIQNNTGLTPLHLACKLGRKKIINKLTGCPFIDTNLRTLDGKLPEDMTKKRSFIQVVKDCRALRPPKNRKSIDTVLSTSTAPSFISRRNTEDSACGSSVNFDKLNDKLKELRNNRIDEL